MQHITKENMKIKYENSLIYQINSSAKYFDKLFKQFFEEINLGVTADQHLALMIVHDTKNCCQRDLARILLKDRANTGKLAKSLEDKGLIKIETTTKNNRLVKILTITKNGEKLAETSMKLFEPLKRKIEESYSEKQLNDLKNQLYEFTQIISKALKTNI